MKILVVGHSYIVDLNCTKWRELAKISPNIEVRIIVPKIWNPKGVQNNIIKTEFKDEGNLKVIPVSNFSQNHQGLLCFGLDIINILKTFKPDIIQVEQGVKSLAYAQFIILNKLLNIQAKNCFFTWWNIPYNLKFLFSWLEKFNLKYTDGLVAGNQDAVDILKNHGYEGKNIIMPNLGVDEKLFCPQTQPDLKKELGINDDDFVIGFVGRFVPEKGILTLINAVSELKVNKSWKLLLLGRGELEKTIIDQAEKLGIKDQLIIIPSVPHDQVPKYINVMNTLVLPSQTDDDFQTISAKGWKEQFGHVLIEAMACKVPVIGSDSGEIPLVIGDSGLIFPEKNVTALRDCLTNLISDVNLTKKLGQKGYDKTLEKYTNYALAKNLLNFYQNIIET
ncbi:MAG: glycosyltransferase family 4 protein [Cyanobacterium sp. T60_A2020_053]|nr:glycosyltransferase family 4 protein [Cyanobacterium sp. T60_A2020_053]